MPVHKVKSGYKWGRSGKTYSTKAQAERQARAIYASGYKEKKKCHKKTDTYLSRKYKPEKI